MLSVYCTLRRHRYQWFFSSVSSKQASIFFFCSFSSSNMLFFLNEDWYKSSPFKLYPTSSGSWDRLRPPHILNRIMEGIENEWMMTEFDSHQAQSIWLEAFGLQAIGSFTLALQLNWRVNHELSLNSFKWLELSLVSDFKSTCFVTSTEQKKQKQLIHKL